MARFLSHEKGSKAGWAAHNMRCKHASLSRVVTSFHHVIENAGKAGLKGGTLSNTYNKDVHKAMRRQSPWLMGFTNGELDDFAIFGSRHPRTLQGIHLGFVRTKLLNIS